MLKTGQILPLLRSVVLVGVACAPMAQAQSLVREPEDSATAALENVAEFAGKFLGHQDAVARLDAAMSVCALAVGDPEGAITLLQDAGWAGQPAEAGETIFADTGDAANFVTITDEGGDCSIVTTVMGTADAQKNFFDMTDAIGWPPFDWKDDGNLGCLDAPMDITLTARITAANDDCASDTDAKITFSIPE